MDLATGSVVRTELVARRFSAGACGDVRLPRRLWLLLSAPRVVGEWQTRRSLRRHERFTPTCRACWAAPKQWHDPVLVAGRSEDLVTGEVTQLVPSAELLKHPTKED